MGDIIPPNGKQNHVPEMKYSTIMRIESVLWISPKVVTIFYPTLLTTYLSILGETHSDGAATWWREEDIRV